MTIEQEDVIDIVTSNKEEGYLALIISDHLKWDKESEKLLTLQNKINAYLSYIESGQLVEDYPNFPSSDVRIVLTCMYEPNEEAPKFLSLIEPIINETGFHFEWSVFNESGS